MHETVYFKRRYAVFHGKRRLLPRRETVRSSVRNGSLVVELRCNCRRDAAQLV